MRLTKAGWSISLLRKSEFLPDDQVMEFPRVLKLLIREALNHMDLGKGTRLYRVYNKCWHEYVKNSRQHLLSFF